VDDKLWREHRAQLQAHEVFHNFEIQRRKPSGEWMWVSVSGEPIFDKQGQFAGYRGIGRDITAQKRAEPRSSAWRSTTSSPACPTGAC
jgi:PAS domain S-box-containing protein